jgi:heme exporter protein D
MLGPHAGFIIAAYAAVIVVLFALVFWVMADARRQSRLLAELEAEGVTRRSAKRRKSRKKSSGKART